MFDGDAPRAWPGSATTPSSATGPFDYAVLELVFAAGLAGVVTLVGRRERDGTPAVPPAELPLIALASFALADVVAKEKISTWMREPFVQEGADHKPVQAEGSGVRRAIGELLTCTRCMGTWSALALVGLRAAAPTTGRTTVNVLALTGANDVLQGAFKLLSERANRAALENERLRRADG